MCAHTEAKIRTACNGVSVGTLLADSVVDAGERETVTYEEIAERWLALAQENAGYAVKCSDILQGEGRVLCLLLDCPEGLLAGEIQRRIGATTGRVSNVLRQLEEKGLLVRFPGEDDRRKTVAKLTDAGREYAEQIKAVNVRREAGVFERMGKDDAQALLKAFAAYVEAKRG